MKKQAFFRNKVFVVFVCFLLVSGVLINTLFLFNKGVIVRGVKVAGISIGGLSTQKACERLEKLLQKWQGSSLEISLKGKTIETNWQAIGFNFNIEKTVEKAFKIGRVRHIFIDLEDQILALLGKENLTLETEWENEALEIFNQLHFSNYLKASKNATLQYKNGELELISSSSGLAPNWEDFQIFVQKRVSKLQPVKSYQLKLEHIYPVVKNDETHQAKEKALDLLNATPFRIVFQDKGWNIQKGELANWFIFKPVFEKDSNNQILGLDLDKKLIENFLLKIVPQANKSFKNARLEFEDNKIIIKESAKVGTEVLLEESVQEIYEGILNEQSKLDLIVQEIPAMISKDTLSELKIDTLLAEGESDYTGSSLSRVNNIKVGSSKFDGHLIKPNEEFSFNETLGEISGKEGYLPGLVIKEDKLIPEYGGGICQVSTTMFRAAARSGLKITERYPHSFPVSYYNPQGFDATVYPPHSDLRFKNNTSGHILIQRRIKGNHLIFEMYGKDQGREVKIKGPYAYDRDIEQNTFRTVLWQEIYDRDGELLFKDGFWSFYDSPANYPVATEEEEAEQQEEESDNVPAAEASEEN
jgi:vancomycin resistance protein YoaR